MCDLADCLSVLCDSCVCVFCIVCSVLYFFFFFQAEDGIRDLVRSRGLGDVYKRQLFGRKENDSILQASLHLLG